MTTHIDEQIPQLLVGALPDADASAVEAHLQGCAACAQVRAELEELFALLALTLEPAVPNPTVRARILADTRQGRLHRFAGHVSALFAIDDAYAKELLDAVDDPGRWEDAEVPGVRQLRMLGAPPDTLTGFIRVPAGMTVPRHVHHGAEQTLVLQGLMRDDDGALYRPGMVLPKKTGDCHAFVAEGGLDLLCGVVIEGGWTFLP